MTITLNGLENPENIITFTNCPTILTVSDTWTGTKEGFTIEVQSLSGLTDVEDKYISINGYKISGTSDLSKSVGNRFYITSSNTLSNRVLAARTICNALNTIGGLSSQYNIWQETDGNGSFIATVRLEAKDIGIKSGTIDHNFSRSIISTSKTSGSITSTFNGNTTNKVCIDVYRKTSMDRINTVSTAMGTFITTIEKNAFGGEISFDLSPLFKSYTDEDSMSQFQLVVYSMVDSSITLLKMLRNIYAVNGYLVNQGGSFMPRFNGCVLAQNVKRGTGSASLNNSILYVYEPSIVLSLFTDNTISSMNVQISYISSALASVGTQNQVIFAGQNLSTFEINLNQIMLNRSAYVDIMIPNLGTLRYNVIKPLHATDEQQRIYWNNSYGGTSFFDFTGTRTEERKTDIETYDKSLFDYYKSNRAELKKIYSKDVEITVTLTTHNITRDGTWQLFDLQNSFNAWTTVNGKEYGIHITDIKVDETDVAGIYTAEIEYTYSLGDTL